MLHVCCIWVEQVGLDYPEACCLMCLMWPSQVVLGQQVHCLQITLELRCLYAQPLPWVCLPSPALSWGWWVTNSPYVGSGCFPPHPWGIPHILVHWGRATFPPHIPYFPIGSVFYGSLWRQLHGLGLCPQPSRLLPCFSFHSSVYGTVPLSPGMIQPSYWPIETFPQFLHKLWGSKCCFWVCHQSQSNINREAGLSPIHEVIWAESCSRIPGGIIGMD